jgi:membrane-associated protein
MLGNVPFFKAHFSLIGIAIILISIIPPIIAAINAKTNKKAA